MSLLETERLELAELCLDDAAFIHELFNTPSWLKFIGDRGLINKEIARNYINNVLIPAYKNYGFGFYLVKIKEINIPIGICGVIKREALDHADIGFAFLPQFEGKGFGFEAASAIMVHSKKTLGLQKIASITNSDNQRSIKLLDKLGFCFQEMIVLPNETEEIMLFINQ